MPRKEIEIITEAELDKLLLNTSLLHHKWAFKLGFYGCLRVSEIVKLKPDNIDTARRVMRIEDCKMTRKSANAVNYRDVSMSKKLMGVARHLPIGCGVRALEIAFKDKCRQFLGRELHFHCLRHSGVTYWLNSGMEAPFVQKLAGHMDIRVTQIYMHPRTENVTDSMMRIEGK